MFRSTGLFKELVCPISDCDRPNCVFWHEPAQSANGSVPKTANSQTGQRSTSPNFYGYTGYVAANDSYKISSQYAPVEPPVVGFSGYDAPTYSGAMSSVPYQNGSGYQASIDVRSNPASPTPNSINNNNNNNASVFFDDPQLYPSEGTSSSSPKFDIDKVKPELHEDDDVVILSAKVKSPGDGKVSTLRKLKELPLPKVSIDTNDVASIDAEIERLKKLRQQATKESKRKPETEGENTVSSKPKKPISVIGYTPTPLEDLRKQKEEERKRKQENENSKHRKGSDLEKERLKQKQAKLNSRENSGENGPRPAKVLKLTSSDEKEKEKLDDLLGEILTRPKAEEKSKKMSTEKSTVARSSEAAIQMRKQEKGVGLSAEQIAAAKQRIAKPGAEKIVRPTFPSRRLPTPAEQLRLRQESLAKKYGEQQQSKTVKKPVTMEQMYGSKKMAGKSEIRRMAATANSVKGARPSLIDSTNKKVPMAVRLQYLNRIFSELVQLLPLDEALAQAPSEEKAILDKVHQKPGYMVAAVNTLKRLRDAVEGKKDSHRKQTVSHSRVLAGKAADLITVGANGPKRETRVTEDSLYDVLSNFYLMSSEQLANNSYPHFTEDGKAYIEPSPYDKKKSRKTFVPNDDMNRFCGRCCKEYRLCPKGTPVPANCVYHLRGKARIPGKRRNNESTYPCCGGDDSVPGCQYGSYHVSDTLRHLDLEKFVESPPPTSSSDPRSRKVLGIDCEMIYTVWGPALARITVVDMNEQILLDELVCPDHAVLDYNTTFSGITAEDLSTAHHSFDSITERLFEIMNSETILVGHSLESDLKAMRLIHKRIVDTAVLYPHRTENDKKRGLKDLAMDKLNKVIQEELSGHDSKEDAVTAFQLVLHKAKFDGKL